jgi:hypothetical protein
VRWTRYGAAINGRIAQTIIGIVDVIRLQFLADQNRIKRMLIHKTRSRRASQKNGEINTRTMRPGTKRLINTAIHARTTVSVKMLVTMKILF